MYVDESGDHSMTDIDPQYPRFVLAFCMFKIDHYAQVVVPAVERPKFDFFGHDLVVLHEREIRQQKPPFQFLFDTTLRNDFYQRLDELISKPRYGIVASVTRKEQFKERVGTAVSPYDVALEFGLERVFLQLQVRKQVGRKTWVVFESRGKERRCSA
ncbi:MAG: DUF3800 domain-containing protein [Galbitalea sp.]